MNTNHDETKISRAQKLIWWALLWAMVFSLWVAFALLAVNPYLHVYIPGYAVGRPCGWEFVAMILSASITVGLTKYLQPPQLIFGSNGRFVGFDSRFVRIVAVYCTLAILIFIWKYAEFSHSFLR